MTPESLKESMSIPKGITINALLDLDRNQVRSGVSDATRNAIKYTRNMT
jgi:pyrroline-5-carboxylate reductase